MTEWLSGLTHRDWLCNGNPCSQEIWDRLDWSRAYADLGPSPAGNPGPYWHVPYRYTDEVYRLYPRVMLGRWSWVIHQACQELAKKEVAA